MFKKLLDKILGRKEVKKRGRKKGSKNKCCK